MEKFWNIWVEGTDGGYHHKHINEGAAMEEAERLARSSNVKGRKVYVMELIACCEVPETPVEWHHVEDLLDK